MYTELLTKLHKVQQMLENRLWHYRAAKRRQLCTKKDIFFYTVGHVRVNAIFILLCIIIFLRQNERKARGVTQRKGCNARATPKTFQMKAQIQLSCRGQFYTHINT
jgi:hypothetical protein